MEILTNPVVLIGLFVLSLVVGAVWGMKKGKGKEDGGSMQVNAGVVAVVGASALAVLFSLPTLSIDVDGIFTYAFDVVNAFMPLIAIVAGLGLGFNLISKIGGLFSRAF